MTLDQHITEGFKDWHEALRQWAKAAHLVMDKLEPNDQDFHQDNNPRDDDRH